MNVTETTTEGDPLWRTSHHSKDKRLGHACVSRSELRAWTGGGPAIQLMFLVPKDVGRANPARQAGRDTMRDVTVGGQPAIPASLGANGKGTLTVRADRGGRRDRKLTM